MVIGAAIAATLLPGTALAASGSYFATPGNGLHSSVTGEEAQVSTASTGSTPGQSGATAPESAPAQDSATALEGANALSHLIASAQDDVASRQDEARASLVSHEVVAAVQTAASEPTDKVLAYDPAALATIGTQASTGHSICCPSFSCAYADAVLDGTVHDHSYYVCSNCMWTDWGGGNSSFRNVGTNEQLLREAYDQIAAGKPTVIHVAASYGEHWIALIGYQDATDSDHLTLSNFVALDPWDGAQITASERFSLYGDGCEHISERSA